PDAAPAAPPPERQRATTTPDVPTARARKQAEEAARAKGASTARTSIALGAFGYAVLFLVAGVGAGYAALLGARELVARGQPLPGLGTRADLVFPIVLAVVGVLPSWLVYRLGTVVKALVIGGAM